MPLSTQEKTRQLLNEYKEKRANDEIISVKDHKYSLTIIDEEIVLKYEVLTSQEVYESRVQIWEQLNETFPQQTAYLLDSEIEEGIARFEMPEVEGESLSRWYLNNKEKPLIEERLLKVISSLLQYILDTHLKLKIYCLDLHPGNIFVTKDDQVVIIDYGSYLYDPQLKIKNYDLLIRDALLIFFYNTYFNMKVEPDISFIKQINDTDLPVDKISSIFLFFNRKLVAQEPIEAHDIQSILTNTCSDTSPTLNHLNIAFIKPNKTRHSYPPEDFISLFSHSNSTDKPEIKIYRAYPENIDICRLTPRSLFHSQIYKKTKTVHLAC